ncbi:MAG: BlaI/MecI/CopY family transcriptional regulator [Candidatus Acidiferrales bacterium]
MSDATANRRVAGNAPHVRRSILELAPLELDCMNALWSAGEGTVRQIQQLMASTRPRAYTTIMTILDRLAQKGVVARQKSGRAYMYRPNLTAEQARAHAVERIVDGFFEGSTQALAAQLAGAPSARLAAPIGIVLPATAPRAERVAGAQRKSSATPSATAPDASSEPALDAALL